MDKVEKIDKEEKFHNKKVLILEALKRCLSRDVYSNISLQEVADEANYSKGGLLHYFSSKEDMYLELVNFIFEKLESDQMNVIKGNLRSKERASISALHGIESFYLDPGSIRILLNLYIYACENEKIMSAMRAFIRKDLTLYSSLIEDAHQDIPKRRKTDMHPQFMARMMQIIMMNAGLFEIIDPVPIEQLDFMRYIVNQFKG